MPRRGTRGELWFGIILVVLGAGFLAEKLSGYPFGEVLSRWWPSLLIFFGVLALVRSGGRHLGGGLLLILIGIMFQLEELDVFPWWRGELFWPVLLIFIGLWMLVRRMTWRPSGSATVSSSPAGYPAPPIAAGAPSGAPATSEEHVDAFAFWSGIERNVTSRGFRGGDATAIMGGIKLDLRNAELAPGEQHLHLTAIMGGIEVWVPTHWQVSLEATPIMGGVADKRSPGGASSSGSPGTLRLHGFAFWGSVEIKN